MFKEKRKTKFNNSWKDTFQWVSAVKGDTFTANCNICNKTFSIHHGGISDIKQHSKTDKHVKNADLMKGQRGFSKDTFSLTGNSSSSMSSHEKVLRAEIIELLDLIDKNQSFSSCNGDGNKFRKMFPDSNIAKNFNQQETKAKYTIQFGIAQFVKDQLISDVTNKPFSFKFDETTTSQTKKQYDAYLTFFSDQNQTITTAFCGSLYVGHCTAEDLVSHFFEFIKRCGLSTFYLISIGMDGPAVNKSFAEKLKVSLKTNNTSFIDIGSCPLHSVNNAFANGLKVLKGTINLDQIAIDLHFFFKLSAARREDYKEVSSITEITTQFVLKHCQTRWLSLDRVLVRILEQFENLKEYFLVKLPSLPGFSGKNGIRQTERYQRIKNALTSRLTKAYMSFVVNVAQNFKDFILPLQSSEPKIHILHNKCTKLVTDIAQRFVGKSKIYDSKGILLRGDELMKVVKNKENHKVKVDMGTHVKSLESKLQPLEQKSLNQNALNFLEVCCIHLLNHLPLENQVVRDARYLQFGLKEKKSGINVFSRLSLIVGKTLGGEALNAYFGSNIKTHYDLCDKVKQEYSLYQMEKIPESFITKKKDESVRTSKPNHQQKTYWKEAYGLIDLDVYSDTNAYRRCDEYWSDVSQMKDSEGKAKYKMLSQLSLCILALPHGNADPERGFSLNKNILAVHGYSLKEETLEAIRLVKDFVIRNGGVLNITISKDLIECCKSSHTRYQCYLSEQRKIEREEEARQKVLEEKECKDQLIREKAVIIQSIKVAENCVDEGNAELEEITKSKTINRDKLIGSQSKISMGLKRKAELSAELEAIEIKIKKYK